MVAFLVLGSKDNHSLIFAQLIFAQLIFAQLIFAQLIFAQLIFAQLIFFNGSEEVPAHFAWAFE
jgi:hypothetical protein